MRLFKLVESWIVDHGYNLLTGIGSALIGIIYVTSFALIMVIIMIKLSTCL